jgi:hypothetical protein
VANSRILGQPCGFHRFVAPDGPGLAPRELGKIHERGQRKAGAEIVVDDLPRLYQ